MGAVPMRGVRLAVDVGAVRVGVARCDPDGILASPVDTLAREPGTVQRIVALVEELEALVVYVGLPVSMSGAEGLAADAARAFAVELAGATTCPVFLVDERLSTVDAQRALRDAGRSARSSRSIVDQVAAVIILEQALAIERATGTLAGTAVTV